MTVHCASSLEKLPAQHMLFIRQPGQEPGGEQALRHRPGSRRRAGRPGPRASAPPPVAAPPPRDPGDLHPPVDVLTVLGAQKLKRLPALRAAPLGGLHIDDPFLSLQMRMIPPPVTRPARPLPPLTRAAAWPASPLPAVPPRGRPPFSDDEPNSNPLSVVTPSCSVATCPASSATRAVSPALSARNAAAAASRPATRASAPPARARQ
jgi:hypothetical protein